MRRIRSIIVAVVGLLLATTTLVAPTVPAQAATASGTIKAVPGQRVTAQFKDTKLDKKRTVTLYSRATKTSKWVKAETAKMTAKGAVIFSTVAAGEYYAVANTFKYTSKKKKVTAAAVKTPEAGVTASWAEEFTGTKLSSGWDPNLDVGYRAGGRRCSSPVAGNISLKGGLATLKVTKASAADAKKVNAEVKAEQKKALGKKFTDSEAKVAKAQAGVTAAKKLPAKTSAQKKARTAAIKKAEKTLKSAKAAHKKLTDQVVGCPYGVYRNVLLTSSKKISAGTVVARVKFSAIQGAHGGVWLYGPGGQEIDMIESYGFGRGISSNVHRVKSGQVIKELASDTGYVAAKTVAKKAWWSKWHTVAVKFDSKSVTFYVDGVKTRTATPGMTGDYSVMMSLLSSDWETYRIKKPHARPGSGVKKSALKKSKSLPTMQVDWIRTWGS